MKKTKEVNEKYMKEIYLNILKAIIIITYFFVLNLSYENVRNEYLNIGVKVFTMIFLFLAIYIFEKAYKNDNDNLAIQGLEILALSTYTLTTEHIINKFKFDFKSYSLVASYLFATYFILKCIIVYTKGRKELVEERSDIREIVKKNEPIKKENTKKSKEDNIDNEEKKINETPNMKKKKSTTKTSEVKKTTRKKVTLNEPKEEKETTKKKETTNIIEEKTIQKKKSVTTNTPKENKEISQSKKSTKANTSKVENTVKSRKKTTTTKKKTNVSKLDDKNNENNNTKQEEKPKRKRVKKEVTEND